ncbi:MAG: transposase [Desulfobacterales bacterium]|nr:transposase [Desulfobacterales bacterium]
MNLFKQKPTIKFYPQISDCSADLKVLKSREKNVATLDIGPFRAEETILHNGNGRVYHSEQLRALTPYRCTYGYDVLVYVGRALFIHSRNEQQIIEDLGKKNVEISPRQIGFLGKKFIVYLAIAHQQSRQQLKQEMVSRGGYILHLDGTCEGDSPHLFTGIDGIAQIVLDNIKLPSEKAALLIPFFRQIKQQYGDPIALVHDMGKGILSAVNAVFKGIPDFICHFHFLRDIGKDLFEKEYAKIRNRLRKHKIRPLLRQRIKALEKVIGDDPRAVCTLAAGIDSGCIDPAVMDKMPAIAAYAMIHWTLDTSELEGYGFPFDCPHLIFYQRLKILRDIVENRLIRNRVLSKLWGPLTKIVDDPQLKKAGAQMQNKVQTFKNLRKALRIAVPNSNQGLNDDGQEADIKSIEEKVKGFRKEMEQDKDYSKMIDQIDKYWDKLFADPITVDTPTGQFNIQPQRTNNILERFFRDIKRRNRKRSGTLSLNKTLRSMLADTPLVKNLDNPDYVTIILDGCSTLEERFSKIDSGMVVEKLKAEQKKQQRFSPEMKKIIQQADLPERLTSLLAA